jgi:hypothetical protein
VLRARLSSIGVSMLGELNDDEAQDVGGVPRAARGGLGVTLSTFQAIYLAAAVVGLGVLYGWLGLRGD